MTGGYPPEMVEKVRRLLQLLGAMRSHPFLKERLALKGALPSTCSCGMCPDCPWIWT